jgi:LPXTG-motif cell wall-anchored protein
MTYELGTGGTAEITGLAPSGQILYPGAEVDGSNLPVAWPGWIQNSDGSWSGPDSYKPSDGKRGMNVTFTASNNPRALAILAAPADSASAYIDYPPATPSCDANPGTEPTPEPTPTTPTPSTSTGSTSAPAVPPTSGNVTSDQGTPQTASGDSQNNAVLPHTGAGNAAGVGLVGLLFIAAGAWVVRLARRPRSH